MSSIFNRRNISCLSRKQNIFKFTHNFNNQVLVSNIYSYITISYVNICLNWFCPPFLPLVILIMLLLASLSLFKALTQRSTRTGHIKTHVLASTLFSTVSVVGSAFSVFHYYHSFHVINSQRRDIQ